MDDVTQIAFQVSNDDLRALDEAVPDEFPSRAAALRAALSEWLERRRQAAIDRALEEGYADVPEDAEMVRGLTSAATDALAAADLDW